MKAASIQEYGDPGVLKYVDAEVPQPAPDQVVIQVKAAGINPFDLTVRSGAAASYMPLSFPAILGIDVAGVVVAAGREVTECSAGDEVIAWTGAPQGSYAEFTLARDLIHKPSGLSFEDAATLPLAVETANRALDVINVSNGDRVLIHGATGVVGAMAAQLARNRGAHVYGTGSATNQNFIAALGVTPVVYGADLAERMAALPEPINAVLDAAGSGVLAQSIEIVGGNKSRIVTIADSKASDLGIEMTTGGKNKPEDLAEVARLVEKGEFKVTVAKTFSLADASKAHEYSASSHTPGKVLLVPLLA